MSTATTHALSDASRCRDMLIAMGATADEMPVLGIPAPCSASHSDYRVGYYSDGSVLIWSRGHGFVLPTSRERYYADRSTLEHLARCLAIPQADRAAMLASRYPIARDYYDLDGIRWGADGSYLGITDAL